MNKARRNAQSKHHHRLKILKDRRLAENKKTTPVRVVAPATPKSAAGTGTAKAKTPARAKPTPAA